MTAKTGIIHNFLSLVAAEIITRAGGILLSIYIARTLGADAFGQLSFALAITAYLQLFTDFGLTTLGVKEISINKGDTPKIGSEILSLQLVLSAISILVLSIVTYFIPLSLNIKIITFLFGLTVIPAALNISYIFQAYERMQYVALTKSIGQISYVVIGFLLIFQYRTILVLPIVQLLAGLVTAAVVFYYAKRVFKFAFSRIEMQSLRSLIIRSTPFVLTAFMVQVFYNSDTIFLQFMAGSSAVGHYQAGYKLVLLVVMVSSFLNTALYPGFSIKSVSMDMSEMAPVFTKIMKIVGLFVMPIAIIWVIQADDVLALIYDKTYVAGAGAFAILSLGLIIVVYNQFLGTSLLATGGQKLALKAVTIAAAINILLNFFLIPRYGLVGAALATFIAEIGNLLYMQHHMRGYLTQSVLRSYILTPLWPIIGLGLCGILFKYYLHLPWIGMILAAIIYISLIFICRILTLSQLKLLVRSLLNKESINEFI